MNRLNDVAQTGGHRAHTLFCMNTLALVDACVSYRSLGVRAHRPLTPDSFVLLDVWWRAANHPSAGQAYQMGNPVLHVPLALEHIKPGLLPGVPKTTC
jgi:hypothetical protein